MILCRELGHKMGLEVLNTGYKKVKAENANWPVFSSFILLSPPRSFNLLDVYLHYAGQRGHNCIIWLFTKALINGTFIDVAPKSWGNIYIMKALTSFHII